MPGAAAAAAPAAPSTTVADVVVPKGTFGKKKWKTQKPVDDDMAARELMHTSKSQPCPLHDAMGKSDEE